MPATTQSSAAAGMRPLRIVDGVSLRELLIARDTKTRNKKDRDNKAKRARVPKHVAFTLEGGETLLARILFILGPGPVKTIEGYGRGRGFDAFFRAEYDTGSRRGTLEKITQPGKHTYACAAPVMPPP